VSDRPHIAFIGGGNVVRSLVGGLVAHGHPLERLVVAEPQAALREALSADFGVRCEADNVHVAAAAEVVVFAVKPQVMAAVCGELAPLLRERPRLVLSIAAGIRIAQLERMLGAQVPIVRAMPNTAAAIGAGVAGLHANALASEFERRRAGQILAATGTIVWLGDEAALDVVTAVSGSGPAYFFLLMEALEAAAISRGLPAVTARELTLQTALGAARMARASDAEPAELRQRVTSSGGTTEAALQVLEHSDFRALVEAAVAGAVARARELSDQFEKH
jgi:pyrroline-5-carboxylate reductase